jgi:hypothetical protein
VVLLSSSLDACSVIHGSMLVRACNSALTFIFAEKRNRDDDAPACESVYAIGRVSIGCFNAELQQASW